MQITSEINAVQLEELFRRHFHDLTRYAYSIVKDYEQAEDVTQQIFVKLWEKRQDIGITDNAKAYLYRATYNASINKWKRNKRQTPIDESHHTPSGRHEEASDLIVSQDLENRIEEAISALPDRCQEVFRLSRFSDMSYKEIAVELDISVKTVENQMGKALKLMRSELSEYLPHVIITLLISAKW